jgi:predicted RNA binding protein YcfA (HicA-like mRNA interferase family)
VPSEVRFAIVRQKLERAGWVLQRVSGSHHVFTKPGHRPVIVPVHHNKVKPVYVQKVDKICREGDAGNGA